jgi:hypothetical protein
MHATIPQRVHSEGSSCVFGHYTETRSLHSVALSMNLFQWSNSILTAVLISTDLSSQSKKILALKSKSNNQVSIASRIELAIKFLLL